MKNRHLIITGGTGGLGLSVTQLALNLGARITIPYHSQSEVERLKQSLTNVKINEINFVSSDLRDEKNVMDLFNDMEKLDILIHLVGGFAMGSTSDFSLEDWRRQIDLNMTTTFLVCKHGLRRMKDNNYGRIVTVGSRVVLEPAAKMAAYSASKAGVLAFTRAIAEETKGTPITANTVLPSIIDTPANRLSMGENNAANWVTPESLAEVICFLASEKAADLRGAAIPVYGNV
jgi:NAD(P)-dependent dehydrogenase (short-subunit alcohol dehydrogenase family)